LRERHRVNRENKHKDMNKNKSKSKGKGKSNNKRKSKKQVVWWNFVSTCPQPRIRSFTTAVGS
jgi:hypothetical protein